MNIIENLKTLGLELPEVSTPGGNYQSVNVRGKIAYIAIQFPILNEQFLYQGILGKDQTTEDGFKAMQLCALNVIAQINYKIGFENILGLNHMDAYYVADKSWDNAPKIVNGASDLFIHVLGEKGHHSRAIMGVDNLPRGFCAGVTTSFTLI
ncbi:MAG: RidA family protein [Cyclobacteriaceae bacterium]|nr:RidA family protein [Cyclobacteriaceae bacterium SS2]